MICVLRPVRGGVGFCAAAAAALRVLVRAASAVACNNLVAEVLARVLFSTVLAFPVSCPRVPRVTALSCRLPDHTHQLGSPFPYKTK